MKAWEKEVYRLDLHRAYLRFEIEEMIFLCYNSFYLRKLEIQLNAVEYNIAVYRTKKPHYIREVSHLLFPLEWTLF